MQNTNQIRILLVKDYIEKNTDEQHPAAISDIIEYLCKQGVAATRKTIYADIEALLQYGVDIITIRSRKNQYFVGNRLFQLAELKMLADVVVCSRAISTKKTAELIEKLCRLSSYQQADEIRNSIELSKRIKPENETVYYWIDGIQAAILRKRQIRFCYYEYTPQKEKILKHGGAVYCMDPYGLEWSNNHYYLIGFSHKHQKIAHFRVDRLCDVTVTEKTFQPIEGFQLANYVNRLTDMFAGETTLTIQLLCANDLMRVVIDQYGTDVKTEVVNTHHFLAEIEVVPSPTFYGWVFQFEGEMQILSPPDCVEEFLEITRKIVEQMSCNDKGTP